MNTLRILLSLTTHFNWQLQQFDTKNAFLRGGLEEEIYMEIPPDFAKKKKKKQDKISVCNRRRYSTDSSKRQKHGLVDSKG